MSDSNAERHRRLVKLIRQSNRQVAWEIVDQHLDDCKHKEAYVGVICRLGLGLYLRGRIKIYKKK